ncbi:hypothetical protein RYA05_01500 [Pseudomonas syringae pv. actinidiae]|nr:hypothetical protein [Pseudomonas syringae pv. actinidiae]
MSITDSELRYLRKRAKDAVHEGLIYAQRNTRGVITSGLFMSLLHKGFLKWSTIANFTEITEQGYAALGRPIKAKEPIVQTKECPIGNRISSPEKKLVAVEVPVKDFVPSSWDVEPHTTTEYHWV